MPAVTEDNKNFKFKPYLSFHGKIDVFLSVDHFWFDKFIVFILYGQRLALLLLWNVGWPEIMLNELRFAYAFLLDFSAHTDVVAAIGGNSFFRGCGTICLTFWPLLCLPVLFLWAGIYMYRTQPLYYTRNVERVLWTAVRLGLLPFVNTLVRYFILGSDGNTANTRTTWVTPKAEVGSLMLIVTLTLFFLFGYQRSAQSVLFKSTVRHEAFIRGRELEYLLRFSTTYRNDRLWMISSYTYASWFWSLARGAADVFFLFVMYFLPIKVGIVVGNIILGANFFYGAIFVSLYRCHSTNWIENVLNGALVAFAVFAGMRAYNVETTWLVGNRLGYFLIAIHGVAGFLFWVMMLYFFFSSHRMGDLPMADKRANEKWRRIFGEQSKGGWVQMEKVELVQGVNLNPDNLNLKGSFVRKPSSRHVETRAGERNDDALDSFYLPKESKYFSLDCESSHVWPVNTALVNELLRRNQEDHLIDLLRAARRMLDRISALSNSAVLIPIDEIRSTISRLQQCVTYCKRQRVTHHMNAIHPLQGIFEDMIEQFTFELRIFSGRSVTVGHNAKKMIEVSRVLRKRMVLRDKSLALVSPLMRRILIKLVALRLFIQLIEERPAHLMRDIGQGGASAVEDEGFGERDENHSSDDEDEAAGGKNGLGKARSGQFDGAELSTRASSRAEREEIDPFADNNIHDDPFADEPEEAADADARTGGRSSNMTGHQSPTEQTTHRRDTNTSVEVLQGHQDDEEIHEMARLMAREAKKITDAKAKERKKDQ